MEGVEQEMERYAELYGTETETEQAWKKKTLVGRVLSMII
jgi:hypothetical protein